MDPVAVFARYDTLGAEDRAVLGALIESLEGSFDAVLRELLGCLEADGIEDFVSVVMMLAAVADTVFVIALAVILMVMILVVMVVMLMFLMVVVMLLVVMVMIIVVIVMMVVMLVSLCLSQSRSHVSCREGILDRA